MNLMINDYCNLDCGYCFAKKQFSNDARNISMENFNYYINFLKKSNHRSLRLLGGEPTLHPNFSDMVRMANNDSFFNSIVIFSNGLSLTKELVNEIVTPKVSFLINLNHKKDIGEKKYNKTIENIIYLVDFYKEHKAHKMVTLGINIYDYDFDYQYIIDETKKLGLGNIRYSITIPQNLGENIGLSHYEKYIPQLMRFLTDCYNNGISARLDCNNIPKCLFTKEQLIDLVLQHQDLCCSKNNLCGMPMDVNLDLECTRCFTFFNDCKVNIKDFNNIFEIQKYFNYEIDKKRFIIPTFEECKTCKNFINKKCQGGCLTYKFKK